MEKLLTVVGQVYTALSLAGLPVAVIVLLVFMRGFKEHGPQSQGLGALLVISAMILGVLLVNAIVAGVLSYFVVEVRPTLKLVGIYFVSMLGLAGLFYISMTMR